MRGRHCKIGERFNKATLTRTGAASDAKGSGSRHAGDGVHELRTKSPREYVSVRDVDDGDALDISGCPKMEKTAIGSVNLR